MPCLRLRKHTHASVRHGTRLTGQISTDRPLAVELFQAFPALVILGQLAFELFLTGLAVSDNIARLLIEVWFGHLVVDFRDIAFAGLNQCR